ncbi:MAG: exo-alpha-sialidase [Candidatus Thermoplasmatota archaeon]|nr:exo-alpha-sialidase [Candidatus Thermoplasmatota archaeon]
MKFRTRRVAAFSIATLVTVLIIVVIMIFANSSSKVDLGGSNSDEEVEPLKVVDFQDPYVFNKEGYEPGIAMDSTGAMYYTAHKNLDDKTSWDYLASWFFVSTDDGMTWSSPTDPFPRGTLWQTYLGDEGDIAVDASDNVYFVDTYLIDNHIHVWADQGQYQYSVRVQKTSGLDDRPWITAQGNNIVHYLGNNAVEVNGGRYWYYRSTNGARTFSRPEPVPGNGWAHIDCERNGDHVYVVSESDTGADADILMYVSNDMGVNWNWDDPILIGHRDGPGREYPIVSAQDGGVVWVLWNDAENGVENGTRIFIGRSLDFGQTWMTWEITPFQAFIDYPTINTGPDGSVAVAFYASRDLPITPESEWYIYGGMDLFSSIHDPDINFTIADPTPCYVGDDLHALHDFFEIVIGQDKALNIAYQYYVGPENGRSDLYFVRGVWGKIVMPPDEVSG